MPVNIKNTEAEQREIDCVFVVFGRDADGQPMGHSVRDSYVYMSNNCIGFGEPDLFQKDDNNSQSYIHNDEVSHVTSRYVTVRYVTSRHVTLRYVTSRCVL